MVEGHTMENSITGIPVFLLTMLERKFDTLLLSKSTDGGSNWVLYTARNYNGQTSWNQESISMPQFANQATLRFGFRFVNTVGTGGHNPSFAIDDFQIVGLPLSSVSTTGRSMTSSCHRMTYSL